MGKLSSMKYMISHLYSKISFNYIFFIQKAQIQNLLKKIKFNFIWTNHMLVNLLLFLYNQT